MATREVSDPSGYLELAPDSRDGSRPCGAEPAAIYVHFPFCVRRCSYCDFDTSAGQERLIEPYLDAVIEQVRRSPPARARSLYVGGGTPSIMSPDQAARLVRACRDSFHLADDAETTLEANPSGLDQARLDGFREAGFNRLSLGVQSTDPQLLGLLGRSHGPDEASSAVGAARSVGFTNLSLDLIYGVPLQDQRTWRLTLDAVVGWNVEHLSCYMLTVEHGTPLERAVTRGELSVPPDDDVVAMYETAREILGSAGYHRYEISNWSRPGFESRHNLAYWRNQSYLGIGAGAAGNWQGRRYKIRPDIAAFVDGVRLGRVPLSEDEMPDSRHSMSDTLIMGLRLDEGISTAAFRARHGAAPQDAFQEPLDWAEQWGLIEQAGDRLKLTERGILLSNELFSRLL